VAVKKLCQLQRTLRGLERRLREVRTDLLCDTQTTLGITPRSVQRILHNDLYYHPYKIQALNTRDYGARVSFCQEMLDLIGEDEDLVNDIWVSDEAHFHVSGFINKQHFRYWSQANPPALHEKPLHSQIVTVWCATSASGIIGP